MLRLEMNVRDVIRTLERDGWHQVAPARQPSAVPAPGQARQGDRRRPSRPRGRTRYAGQHLPAGPHVEGGSLSTWTTVYEKTSTGWSAYVPALPGVGVAGATHEETEQLITEAIVMHLKGVAEDGLPIPHPESVDIGHVDLSRPA